MAEVETKNTNNVTDNQQNADPAPKTDNATDNEQENAPTVESLMAEIAKMKADAEKQKLALDKAMKERGDAVKALREKQSAEEIADAAKLEQEEAHKEYVNGLEKFKNQTLAEKRYLLQGMDAKTAEAAAEAEIEGDMDKLATIQSQFREAEIKRNKAEWMKSIPEVNRGTGNAPTMTEEQIFAIKDPIERQKAIAANMALFNGK